MLLFYQAKNYTLCVLPKHVFSSGSIAQMVTKNGNKVHSDGI